MRPRFPTLDSTIVVVAAVSAARIGADRPRRISDRPGRCDPHPSRNLAHDPGSTAARRAVVSRLAVALREGWLTKAGAPRYAHEDTYFE